MYYSCANLCPWRVNWAAMARKEGVAARALSVTESDTDLGEHVTLSAPANTVALRKSRGAAVVVEVVVVVVLVVVVALVVVVVAGVVAEELLKGIKLRDIPKIS